RAADGGGSVRRPPPARGVLPDPVPVPWRVGRAHAMGDSRLLPGSRRPLTPTPRPGSSQGCALQGADGGGRARSPWGFPGRGPLALVSDLSRAPPSPRGRCRRRAGRRRGGRRVRRGVRPSRARLGVVLVPDRPPTAERAAASGQADNELDGG